MPFFFTSYKIHGFIFLNFLSACQFGLYYMFEICPWLVFIGFELISLIWRTIFVISVAIRRVASKSELEIALIQIQEYPLEKCSNPMLANTDLAP